jgi:hypothetical protein
LTCIPPHEPILTNHLISGLAWHTEEGTLRQKFEEFGAVEEAVCGANLRPLSRANCRLAAPALPLHLHSPHDCCQLDGIAPQARPNC